jgi:hypothetical protein
LSGEHAWLLNVALLFTRVIPSRANGERRLKGLHELHC